MVWVYIVGVVILVLGFSVFFGAPYVPSRRRDVKRMFDELYALGEHDTLVDLGSGDGLILREVSRRGAHAVGYEISPLLLWMSRILSWRDDKVRIYLANHWLAQFPTETTVVYAFSVERDVKKLERKIQSEANRLKKSLVLICYSSPLLTKKAVRTFEAYHLYEFYPLQVQEA